MSRVVEGRSIALGSRGTVDAGSMLRHPVTETDLQQALHNAGVESTAETRLIVLQPSGKISVLKRG